MAIITGLVGYWALNETGPGIGTPDTFFPALDAQGSNPLTDVGGCGSVAGKVGLCRTFSGSRCLSHVSNSSLQVGNYDFSFSCWLYAPSGTPRQSVLAKLRAYPVGEYELQWYKDFSGATGSLIFYINSANAAVGGNPGTPSIGLAFSTWHHVACGYIAATQQLFITVNNATMETFSTSEIPAPTDADFRIGANADPSYPYYFNGRIDEVGFWKRQLTVADIAWLYNGGAGRSYADIVAEQTQSVSGSLIPSVSVVRSPLLAQLPPVTNDLFAWLL